MKYTGELAQQITLRLPSVMESLGDDFAEREGLRIAEALAAKLPALARAHGVREGDWYGLVLALASAHVKGFQLIDPPGRPVVWEEMDKAEFRLDVDAAKLHADKSLSQAIERVKTSERWAQKARHTAVSALKQHYYKADPRLIVIAEKARKADLHSE